MKNDFKRMDTILSGERADIVPLYEHFLDREVIEAIMGWKLEGDQRQVLGKLIQFYSQMGYDYMPFETGPRFAAREGMAAADTAMYSRGNRNWVDEHGGPIQGWADLENSEYWPDDIFDYHAFDLIAELMPENMKVIGGCSGGPFEHASFLMGFTPLCMVLHDDPEFAQAFFDKIGNYLVTIAEKVSALDVVGAYRFGDDMGYKTATMLSPEDLRKYVFPWSKRIVAAVHGKGKRFVLHSCGNLNEVMDDLIDDVGIDAKHSWEDVIMPVTEAKRVWGKRIALLGGVDLDYLCRHTPEEIMEYTKRVLDVCGDGGYALGTGNTVTNYVPTENYLAMLRAWRQWNGIA